jgi:hypothetical protein
MICPIPGTSSKNSHAESVHMDSAASFAGRNLKIGCRNSEQGWAATKHCKTRIVPLFTAQPKAPGLESQNLAPPAEQSAIFPKVGLLEGVSKFALRLMRELSDFSKLSASQSGSAVSRLPFIPDVRWDQRATRTPAHHVCTLLSVGRRGLAAACPTLRDRKPRIHE